MTEAVILGAAERERERERESYTSKEEKYSFVKQFFTNTIKVTENKQGRNTFINCMIRQAI